MDDNEMIFVTGVTGHVHVCNDESEYVLSAPEQNEPKVDKEANERRQIHIN